jgi:hypothetical protein
MCVACPIVKELTMWPAMLVVGSSNSSPGPTLQKYEVLGRNLYFYLHIQEKQLTKP